jgi:hypothetical protein
MIRESDGNNYRVSFGGTVPRTRIAEYLRNVEREAKARRVSLYAIPGGRMKTPRKFGHLRRVL